VRVLALEVGGRALRPGDAGYPLRQSGSERSEVSEASEAPPPS
jgi:hypothetical protein